MTSQTTHIWGCQWDDTMQWFLSSANSNTVKYVKNSSGQGYYGHTSVASTGQYKVNNIYDMAGNCWEQDLEAISDEYRVLRRWRLQL